MAKKKKSTYTKPVQTKATAKAEPKKGLTAEAKEPSKGELIFFRIGMIVILTAVVGFAAIILINWLTNKEEENPYEDYVTITQAELDYIVSDNGDNTFGDRSYFQGNDDYTDLLGLLNDNVTIYFYFYRSSDIEEDILAAILDQTSVGAIPTLTLIEDNDGESFAAFLFIDLDATANADIFSDTTLSNLGLDEESDNMLVTFDSENPDNEFFSMEDNVDDIIDIINNL